MKRNTTAGSTRKSHKTRKTTPTQASEQGPSSTALATQAPLPALPSNPVLRILKYGEAFKTEDEGALAKADSKDDANEAGNTGVPAIDPKKQWWYRPADSKARKLVEKIVVMRAAGHDDKEIAKRLHTTEGSVRQYVYVAKKNGWLDADDEPVDIESELALTIDRKIVRNIDASLDGNMTNWQTHEMTIAAAKGRGHFKTHEVSKNEGSSAMPVVAIQVIMPPVGAGDQLPEVREDQMGGVPAYTEGDILEGTESLP